MRVLRKRCGRRGTRSAMRAKTLTLTGASAAGLFYAAQTAKQMIERWPLQSVCKGTCPDFVLHAAEIHDWPAMRYRGLHDDLSRGPVDTLEFQKKLIRTLAAYKINVYSPYFENTQQYASNPLPAPPEGSISADDARELVAYAAKYHIIVIPEQEAIGHLRKMLQWETYADVAETPHGAVLSPGQAGSIPLIDQMFKELAELYPGPFLHIGGDETIDLGIGRTRADVDARGLPTVYIDYLQRIVTSLEPLHKKILFLGRCCAERSGVAEGTSSGDQASADCGGVGIFAEAEGISAGVETLCSGGDSGVGVAFDQQLSAGVAEPATGAGGHPGVYARWTAVWRDGPIEYGVE